MTAAGSQAPPRSAFARLVRNGGLTASAEVLSKVCSLLLFVVMARRFGGATLGHYVLGVALTSLIWSVGEFGLDRVALRDIARDPALTRAVVVPMALIKASFALAATAVTAVVLAVAGAGSEAVALFVILALATAMALTMSTVQAVFTAHERMEYVFLIKVPWSLGSALLGIAVVLSGGGIVAAVAASSLIAGVVGTTWSWVLLVRHHGAPARAPAVRSWPRLLREALPFGAQEMLGQVIFRFDTVLLAALAASAVVGDYGAAYRMLEGTLFLAWSVASAVMPMYAYLEQGGSRGPLQHIYEGSLKLILSVMLPVAVVLFVCARPVVDLLYGLPEYDGTVPVLRLLAVAVAVYGIGNLSGALVLMRLPGRVTLSISGTVAAVNVVVCLILIPLLDARGAALATLASESLLALLSLVFASRAAGRPRALWILTGPVVGGAAMAAVMTPLSDHLALALPAGAAAYLAGLLLAEAPHLREDVVLFRTIGARRPEPGEAAA